MKLEWITQGQTVAVPAVAFGFDSVEGLVKGQVALIWLRGETSAVQNKHNLVISDTGVNGETLGQAVITAVGRPMVRFHKGNINEGTARDVYPILNDPALPFRAGLTVHAARGTWSSLPHKFEAEEILTPRPMPFYEQFAYVTDPPGGWGVQMRIGHLYEAGDIAPDYPVFVNEPHIIRDRDVADIPLGSHPVTGGPGVRLCYFWVYWGWLEGREKF